MLALQARSNSLSQDTAQQRSLGVMVGLTVPFDSNLPKRVGRIVCELFKTIRRKIHQIDMPVGRISPKLVGDRRIDPAQHRAGRTVLRFESEDQVSQSHMTFIAHAVLPFPCTIHADHDVGFVIASIVDIAAAPIATQHTPAKTRSTLRKTPRM